MLLRAPFLGFGTATFAVVASLPTAISSSRSRKYIASKISEKQHEYFRIPSLDISWLGSTQSGSLRSDTLSVDFLVDGSLIQLLTCRPCRIRCSIMEPKNEASAALVGSLAAEVSLDGLKLRLEEQAEVAISLGATGRINRALGALNPILSELVLAEPKDEVESGDPGDCHIIIDAGAILPVWPSCVTKIDIPKISVVTSGELMFAPGGLLSELMHTLTEAGGESTAKKRGVHPLCVKSSSSLVASVKDGIVTCERADMKLFNALQVASWGTFDIQKNEGQMSMVIPIISLEKLSRMRHLEDHVSDKNKLRRGLGMHVDYVLSTPKKNGLPKRSAKSMHHTDKLPSKKQSDVTITKVNWKDLGKQIAILLAMRFGVPKNERSNDWSDLKALVSQMAAPGVESLYKIPYEIA